MRSAPPTKATALARVGKWIRTSAPPVPDGMECGPARPTCTARHLQPDADAKRQRDSKQANDAIKTSFVARGFVVTKKTTAHTAAAMPARTSLRLPSSRSGENGLS